MFFFFSSRRRHTRFDCDWSSDVCSSDLSCDIPKRLDSLKVDYYPREKDLVSIHPRSWWSDTRAYQCNVLSYGGDRKSTRLNSSHSQISYAVFCLKKKKQPTKRYCPSALT